MIPLALSLLLFLGGCTPGPPAIYADAIAQRAKGFLVVGDTQRTLRIERLLFFREQNDVERKLLIDDISRQDADFLVMVGDLVDDGSSDASWKLFDELMAPVRAVGLAALVALGNHDYWGDNRGAMAKVEARFSQLAAKHWYSRIYGSLGLIWLDTNFGEMGRAQRDEQSACYKSAMAEFQSSAEIKGIVLFTHHPPFTNSKTTGDEIDVQSAFLETFYASPKSLAFVSGHAHAYERFIVNGKTFLVSGGGGGPRVSLLEGAARRHADLYPGPSPRPFHYLRIVPGALGITLTVHGLDKDQTEVRTLEEVTVAFP